MASSGMTRVKGRLPKRSNQTGKATPRQYQALTKIGNAHIREHRKVVAAWENETPTFTMRIVETGAGTELTVMASGDQLGIQKYHWSDLGTPPHRIEAKNPSGRLVFNAPYFPSTEPRVIASRKATRGTDQVVVEGVNHPGVEPRRFTETINQGLREHDARLIREAGIEI